MISLWITFVNNLYRCHRSINLSDFSREYKRTGKMEYFETIDPRYAYLNFSLASGKPWLANPRHSHSRFIRISRGTRSLASPSYLQLLLILPTVVPLFIYRSSSNHPLSLRRDVRSLWHSEMNVSGGWHRYTRIYLMGNNAKRRGKDYSSG